VSIAQFSDRFYEPHSSLQALKVKYGKYSTKTVQVNLSHSVGM